MLLVNLAAVRKKPRRLQRRRGRPMRNPQELRQEPRGQEINNKRITSHAARAKKAASRPP